MKRFPFIVAAMTVFSAAVLVASSPTPTPRPAAVRTWAGPTLDVTFSGMVVFRKKSGGFRVVLADRKNDANSHQAYIRYKTDDVAETEHANTFPDPTAFDCDFKHYEWVPLTQVRLRISPASAIAETGPLDASMVEGWLVHLSRLAKNNSFNEDHYNQANPAAGKVAAQMDIETGHLEPSIMDGDYYPVRWRFKDGINDSKEEICGTSGIRWLLRLRPETQTITLESPSGKPHLILKVAPGKTTTIIVGNSRVEDIACPKAPPKNEDDDFDMHYKMLRKEVPAGMHYVPVRVSPEVKCTPPVPVITRVSKSQRGSDCMGTQWP